MKAMKERKTAEKKIILTLKMLVPLALPNK